LSANHTTVQTTLLMRVSSNDKQKLIPIHKFAFMIDHQYTITITIKGDA
jgi:hypothetical protein